jgi:transcriptional regulator GlxA family with amidase domain
LILLGDTIMTPRTRNRYQAIVERVQQMATGQLGEPLHIDWLCRACGTTERMLRNAFRLSYGTTPYRYLRERRMLEARDALMHAKATATVTSIATQFGFLELGRFSVEYRGAFGERPSDTLRRTASVGSDKTARTEEALVRPTKVLSRQPQPAGDLPRH